MIRCLKFWRSKGTETTRRTQATDLPRQRGPLNKAARPGRNPVSPLNGPRIPASGVGLLPCTLTTVRTKVVRHPLMNIGSGGRSTTYTERSLRGWYPTMFTLSSGGVEKADTQRLAVRGNHRVPAVLYRAEGGARLQCWGGKNCDFAESAICRRSARPARIIPKNHQRC